MIFAAWLFLYVAGYFMHANPPRVSYVVVVPRIVSVLCFSPLPKSQVDIGPSILQVGVLIDASLYVFGRLTRQFSSVAFTGLHRAVLLSTCVGFLVAAVVKHSRR